ncbi:membrane protein FxsA [Mycolicibacterium sp. BiH015]|uniref:FxsA family protein n=1 Tax=Mycolicibacterium sp. BiH015 TaxID=3018808 RepID=UPI0022E636C2|nr:FxsA family protein [Mycolicibacterium sp. BiH015]MDA2890540.1 membrane protein FxsA [Mycolicibacterium sp. BiH015]
MAMRLFLVYVVVELAVLVALVSTIGFGWTLLLVAGAFLLGLALAGSQLRRHVRRLRSGLTVAEAQGAVTDSVLVALGTVLVVIPGVASSVLGALLLLPPTRAAARPVVTAMAARRAPLIVGVGTVGSAAAGRRSYRGRGEYVDGEVIDVHDDPDGIDIRPAIEQRHLPE